MKQQFLGDSYDAVKRLWQEAFSESALLWAEPRYIPEDIRDAFTTITRIPLLVSCRPPFYSIFNDPDTGVRLLDRKNQTEGPTHISLTTIISQLRIPEVRCVLTFDQSHHWERGFTPADQRAVKAHWLRTHGSCAFYYVSHAPFLFVFREAAHMDSAQNRLLALGIPETRIEVAK